MDKYTKDIDDIFKDRLFDHEIPAPADVWGKIDSQMKQKRNRVWIISIGALAASVALILSAGIGYYMGSQKSEKIANNTPKIEDIKTVNISSKNKTSGIQKNNIHTSETNELNIKTSQIKLSEPTVLAYTPKVLPAATETLKSESIEYTENVAMTSLSRKEILLRTNIRKQIVIEQKNIEYMLNSDFYYAMDNNTEEETSENTYNWEMGGNLAPIYSYRNISNNNTGTSSSYYNNSEKPLVTYAGGMNVQLANGRWRIESGVYLSNMGQKIDNIYEVDLASQNDIILGEKGEATVGTEQKMSLATTGLNSSGNIKLNSAGNISRNNIVTGESKDYTKADYAKQTSAEQHFSYLELPFIAHYKVINNFVNLSFSGGFSANFLVANDVYVNQDNKNKRLGTTEDVQKTNFAGIAGLSFEVPIVSRVVFRLEPRVRYYINSVSNSQLISTHPYSIGLYTGISYKF